jgi:DNA (cytosine-5)-methyltransferase 1
MARSTERQLKFIDLFAGVGGIRLGFQGAGCRCVFTSEWDKHSQKTYLANFGDMPHGDITKIAATVIPPFDILTAGFPCQPFSSIGQRQGFKHKTQGTLFFDVARILEHHRPRAFLLENVAGLVTHDEGRTLQTILDVLYELRYDVWYKVLDAADYGVPQHRERIYIVGMRVNGNRKPIRPADSDMPLLAEPSKYADRFTWPKPLKKYVGIGRFVETGVEGYEISKHLQKVYIYKADDGRPQVIDPRSDFPVKTLVACYHKIQRLTGTFVKDGPTGLRLLTQNECKAIMGFPREFQIPVSRTQMYRQMGNSVAVPVIEAIAKAMALAISMESDSAPKRVHKPVRGVSA